MNKALTINTILFGYHIFDILGRSLPRIFKVSKSTLSIIVITRMVLIFIFCMTTTNFRNHNENVKILYNSLNNFSF